MKYRFGRDLRVARRRSALTQVDCAHLLGVNYSRISKFEAGRRQPSVTELAILMLILDQPLGHLTRNIVIALSDDLLRRLATMPEAPATWRDLETRRTSLRSIAARLSALTDGI